VWRQSGIWNLLDGTGESMNLSKFLDQREVVVVMRRCMKKLIQFQHLKIQKHKFL
jgi:hypothetical protein